MGLAETVQDYINIATTNKITKIFTAFLLCSPFFNPESLILPKLVYIILLQGLSNGFLHLATKARRRILLNTFLNEHLIESGAYTVYYIAFLILAADSSKLLSVYKYGCSGIAALCGLAFFINLCEPLVLHLFPDFMLSSWFNLRQPLLGPLRILPEHAIAFNKNPSHTQRQKFRTYASALATIDTCEQIEKIINDIDPVLLESFLTEQWASYGFSADAKINTPLKFLAIKIYKNPERFAPSSSLLIEKVPQAWFQLSFSHLPDSSTIEISSPALISIGALDFRDVRMGYLGYQLSRLSTPLRNAHKLLEEDFKMETEQASPSLATTCITAALDKKPIDNRFAVDAAHYSADILNHLKALPSDASTDLNGLNNFFTFYDRYIHSNAPQPADLHFDGKQWDVVSLREQCETKISEIINKNDPLGFGGGQNTYDETAQLLHSLFALIETSELDADTLRPMILEIARGFTWCGIRHLSGAALEFYITLKSQSLDTASFYNAFSLHLFRFRNTIVDKLNPTRDTHFHKTLQQLLKGRAVANSNSQVVDTCTSLNYSNYTIENIETVEMAFDQFYSPTDLCDQFISWFNATPMGEVQPLMGTAFIAIYPDGDHGDVKKIYEKEAGEPSLDPDTLKLAYYEHLKQVFESSEISPCDKRMAALPILLQYGFVKIL